MFWRALVHLMLASQKQSAVHMYCFDFRSLAERNNTQGWKGCSDRLLKNTVFRNTQHIGISTNFSVGGDQKYKTFFPIQHYPKDILLRPDFSMLSRFPALMNSGEPIYLNPSDWSVCESFPLGLFANLAQLRFDEARSKIDKSSENRLKHFFLNFVLSD